MFWTWPNQELIQINRSVKTSKQIQFECSEWVSEWVIVQLTKKCMKKSTVLSSNGKNIWWWFRMHRSIIITCFEPSIKTGSAEQTALRTVQVSLSEVSCVSPPVVERNVRRLCLVRGAFNVPCVCCRRRKFVSSALHAINEEFDTTSVCIDHSA